MEFLKFLLMFCLAGVVPVCIFAGLIFALVNYDLEKATDGIELKFKDFEKYYCLNPERYHLGEWYPDAVIGEDIQKLGRYELNFGYQHEHIRFNLIDTYRYHFWWKYYEKKGKRILHDQKYRQYLELVQKDIDKVRQESAAYIGEAKEIMKEIDLNF